MHFYKQRKWKRYQLIIFHSDTSYSTFKHGNQFARVQFAELANNNASMWKVSSGYLGNLVIFLRF